MKELSNTIHFTLIFNATEYRVQTNRNRYPSLLALISDYLALPGFGLCCGMGSCGTCLVEIQEKAARLHPTVLACGVQVNDELSNTTIIVLNPAY